MKEAAEFYASLLQESAIKKDIPKLRRHCGCQPHQEGLHRRLLRPKLEDCLDKVYTRDIYRRD